MIKGLGRWELPQPLDIKDETEWIPIPRIARTIPFGYVQDEQDPDLLQPVQNELDKLEMARDYMAAKGVAGLRGVGRPMSVDIAIYESQKKIRELAKKAGMSVKKWRRENPNSKWVKQLYKAKPDMKKADALRGKK